MKERLLEFLRAENKSSAQFAEEIGVQPSGISHILSGRNNPSLDFVLKMLEKYQLLSTDWLLFGKGSMYKDPKMQTLFDEVNIINPNYTAELPQKDTMSSGKMRNEPVEDLSDSNITSSYKDMGSSVVRIVWFYNNNSFVEYFPRK